MSVLTFILITGCGGGNGLKGTWAIDENRYGGVTIEFKGKNFTITEFPFFGETGNREWPSQGWVNGAPFSDRKNIDNEKNDFELLRTEVSFLNRPEYYYRREIKGIYSISDDGKIEFSFSKSGNIDVFSFSRTENTITIDGNRFTLKK